MVTFAQAQERAEEWINGDVPAYQHREVRVREFELGFVAWAEDRADGSRSDGGGQRLVLARDSGEATLWPALPVGEVIRRYEEEYGRPEEVTDAVPAAPARVDLNQTSFLLSPPEWLQEAADKIGIQDRRGAGTPGAGAGVGGSGSASPSPSSPSAGSPSGPMAGSRSGSLPETQAGVPAASAWPDAGGGAEAPGAPGVPAGATPWAGTDTNADPGEDRSVPLPATVFAPPLSEQREDETPADAETALMSGGSQLPPTAVASALGDGNARGGAGSSRGQGGGPGGSAGAAGTPPPSSYGYPQGAGAQGPGGPGPQGAPGPSSYGYPQGAGAPGAPGVPGGAGAAPSGGPQGGPGAGLSSYGYPQGSGGPGGPGGAGASPSGGPQGGPGAGSSSYGYPQGVGGPGGPGGAGASPSGGPQGGPGADPSAYGYPQGPGGAGNVPHAPGSPGAPGRALAPNAGDIADAATSKAAPPPRRARSGGSNPPPPPGAPGTPGARPGASPAGPPPPPPPPAGGYVPTQMVSGLGPEGLAGPGAPNTPGGPPPGGVHQAATMFADPGQSGPAGPGAPQPPGAPGVPGAPGAPGAPQQPLAPGAPGTPPPPYTPGTPGASAPQGGAPGAVHRAETMLAGPPAGGPGAPPAPQFPGAPGALGAPGMPPGAPPQPMPPGAMPPPGQQAPGHGQPVPPGPGQPFPGQQQPAYGYPQQGQPTVGPGYQAVLRYRAPDGSEQQLIRRSAPGTPHPEWQIFHELRGLNIPPDQVLELHTELESCELPGAYCARMIREQWPQARIASIAPYGTDHASRQQGMRELIAHQGELHQVADGPARLAPVRAPLPPVQPTPPIPPEAIAQELAGAFGPGVFRFEQAAVSRQGVPPVVAHTLVAAGLPMDMGPFFWAQAQPGRPVPTLAELAQERGVRPSADAGSYLVMGSDFGKAICVQYGTANIVAVPVEAGPGGASVPPQFVNTGLPEFARCLALLGRMWRLRYGLNQEQAGRWTVDFQAQLASLDPAALGSPESWWSVLLEQMWDGLL
ncbi:SUKH-4 family immunity protein [Streptomyces hokutonensis]|uniref:SUKH-4 family immunity protein n=1 Tax=Streptomyces hokutonensis TaxID=1306990 RepID=UPI003811B12B